jgi:hypothetical protein
MVLLAFKIAHRIDAFVHMVILDLNVAVLSIHAFHRLALEAFATI